ncbi:MAG: RIP metalloprotease RseP [Oligoflexales bacterium]|nr:RIP metalloprotease RseP [Oligoflexales bacterium]
MSFLASNPVLAVLFFIAVLVFVHETGHFLIGKLFGIGVEIYSIGFGPKLFGFEHEGTEYKLCALPLGGYVKFAGALKSEEVPERFKGKEMYRASVWARAATIIAGPAANLLLAMGIYTIHASAGIEHPPSIIGMVMPRGPADNAGFQSGDHVIAIGEEEINSWNDLREEVSRSPGKPLAIKVKRQNQTLSLYVTPDSHENENILGEKVEQGRIGISFGLVPAILTPLPLAETLKLPGQSNIKIEVGDQVKQITFSASSDQDETLKTKTWPDFLEALDAAYQAKAKSLRMALSLAPIPGKKEEGQQEPKLIHLSTSPWYTEENQAALEASTGSSARQQSLARLMGLRDSQITVASPRPPLDGAIQQGDHILAVNGLKVDNIFTLMKTFEENKSEKIAVKVLRGGEKIDLEAPLKPVEVQKAAGKDIYYQFNAVFWGQAQAPPPYVEQYSNPFSALWYGFKETAEKSGAIVGAIAGLITGNLPLKALGGPMLIAKVAGDAAEAGWQVFFTTMALISINLGMLNLFPIPALDGGQLLLVFAEGVRRKPLSEVAMENFQRIGFVMIMALIVLATYNDLSRFWASMLRGVTGMFE